MSQWWFPAAVVIVGLIWVASERTLWVEGLRSLGWPRAKGRIIDSEDRSFLGPGLVGSAATGVGVVKYPETAYYYEYQVGMSRYINDLYCFGVYLDKSAARYVVGDRVQVFFDPNNPKVSVLRRGVPVGTMISAVPVLVGAVFLVFRLCR
jgi:hypothetical protein